VVPNASVASVGQAVASTTVTGGSGLITALGQGGPITVEPTFSACPLLNENNSIAATFSVQHVQSIDIQPEFAGNPSIVVGNTEKMNVYASLTDGYVQDISTQTALLSSQTSILAFNTALGPNILGAVAAGGPVQINATFSGGGEVFKATTLEASAVIATLDAFTLCWSEPLQACPASESAPILAGGTLNPLQLHAIGIFDGGGIVQDVTRGTAWTSSSPTIATMHGVSSVTGASATTLPPVEFAGLVTPGPNGAYGTVQITATNSAATAIPTQQIQVTVDQP
jgi:hypothetical protein